MCTETSYRFESEKCGCVYVYVIACEDARVPIDISRDAKPRWPECKARKGMRSVDGGYLGKGCWELGERGKGKRGRCEKR